MKKILMLLCTILIATACSKATNNEYEFIGESEHWQAEYMYKVTEKWGDQDGVRTYFIKDQYEFVLQYKGSLEELSTMQKLEYSYKTLSSSGRKTEEFTEPIKELRFTSSGRSEGGAKVNEDEVIQVNVKWDDFEESITLQNMDQ